MHLPLLKLPQLFYKIKFRPVTLLKNRPWHGCFPVNFAKFLRIPFSTNTSGRLLVVFDKILNNPPLCNTIPMNVSTDSQ